MTTIANKCRQYDKGSKMSEDQKGYAEGIDRTEASLNIIHTILDVINTEISDLERRIEALEANQAWKGPNG